MGLILEYQDGQTPLDEEEKEGILIKVISTHAELNEHEQLNIEKAIAWTIHSKLKVDKILNETFIKKLHHKMFNQVWAWSGSFRKSNKNIGSQWFNISMELKYLLDDAKYWIEKETYSPDEIAIRFKHRLVSIHCFPNGNGRHSRLMADMIIEKIFGLSTFTWHSSSLLKADKVRKKYIISLQDADKGNIEPLLLFARH